MSNLASLRAATQQRGWYQDLLDSAAGVGQAVASEETVQALLGQDPKLQMLLKTKLGKGLGAIPGLDPHAAMRFAANPATKRVLKFVPGLAAAGGVIGAGDVLFGGDSAANKIMDGTAMTIGGILGSPFGGPVGVAAGAGIGKTASDSLQWLFGDKRSAEERKLEEALIALKGGVV